MVLTYYPAALLTLLHLIVGAVGESCYYPDGSTDVEHFACSTGGTSVCCAEGFECLSNGLCNDYRYNNYERVLRGGCTDKDWGDGCPQTCTSLWPKGDEIVYLCSNGKFCCGRSTECCDDSDAEFFEFGNPQVIATAGKTQATIAPKEENDQTTAQPTKSGEQDAPQETQSQQQDDAASTTKDSSTGWLDEPEATETPANTMTDTSGGGTAKAEATQKSQSDATGTAAHIASQSGSPNTASSVDGTDPAATNTVNNYNKSPSDNNSNHTVAIAAGVGVGVGILVFLLAIVGCWHIRRKRQRPGLRSKNVFEIGESSTPAIEVADSSSGAGVGGKGRGSNRVFELDGRAMGVELPARHEVEEVHGESAEGKKWPGMFT
jgi:hypothetical protein